ncbi:MAG: SagB family peptide dehydrogenase [Micromonosporaceae bacterium]
MIRADGGDLLRLRPGVVSAVAADGEFHLLAWPHGESFGRLTADAQAVVRRLAEAACIRREFATDPDVDRLVDRLLAGGWLTVTARDAERPRYTLVPLGPPVPPSGDPPGHGTVLSRFAVLHRDGDEFVLTSPRAWCRLRVHDPRVLSGLAALTPAGGTGPDERMLHDLTHAGFVVSTVDEEEAELRLAQWSPAELWFHASSRPGSHAAGPAGGTFWAEGRFDPLPERHGGFPGPPVPLRRPDVADLRRKDPPLTGVLEDRCSIREHDDSAPVSFDELGEFLYRCAGARSRPGSGTQARPYPGGGGLYELELYPVVRLVTGLDAGLYHYDPYGHRLVRVPGPGGAARRLLAGVTWATLTTEPPQVLIVISARFGRMMWKYQHMGYAIILKDVGVLLQTMYLVATAMGLAPCAVGSGDSDAFAAATGVDRLAESSVGEFILGSRR